MAFSSQVKFKEEVKENINIMIKIKSRTEIEKMSRAAEIVRDLLFELENLVKPGVTTLELDAFAENFILDQGAKPAFKGLYGFPGTLCVSINDEVVHGVPSNRKLIEGDIIGIDVGSIHEGFYGDHAKTFPVGDIDSDKEKLIDVTKECLMKGINQAKPGNRIGDIGHAIGQELHEEPQIPNYGKQNTGDLIKEGMCFAIEPMINFGTDEIFTKTDNWTICTKDGTPSAHFEHTITVDKDGPRILTV